MSTSELQPAVHSHRPKRRDGVLNHAVADEVVLWDDQNQMAVSLNLSAAAVWELCDGASSVAEITSYLSEVVGCETRALADDVQQAVRQLRDLNLLVGGADESQPAADES